MKKGARRKAINYQGFLVIQRGDEHWDIPYAYAGRQGVKTIRRSSVSGQLVFICGAHLEYVDSFEEGMKLAMERERPYAFPSNKEGMQCILSNYR